jgi:2-amino-4-hydroxy-6-hydroxymethyldihydropteridine diphosphokinase
MRTAVALGSNLGDRLASLQAARKAIVDLDGVQPPVLASAIYETEPVGCESGAEKFLNAVVEFDYEGDPVSLIEELIRIEEGLGRERDHPKNISRKIDIDLLYIGETEINKRKLELPHPRMHVRKFVLQPLADIRPDLILPGQTKTVRELLGGLEESGKPVRFMEEW